MPSVLHDREGLTRILWNLLDNAAKYVGQGIVVIQLFQQQDYIYLHVCDNGQGIAADQRQRLLRPFERGLNADAVAGTGLGLALVDQIVELHGGRFSLLESPTGGLCARVSFPCAGEQ